MERLSITEDARNKDNGKAPVLPALQTDDRKVVRKIERDPWNRLRSIKEDAVWVHEVCDALSGGTIPVVPNLRCGAWYVSPDVQKRSGDSTFCYFKSTDGHADQWKFSLKRPNLDVVRLLQKQGRVIITDSTRRGKSLPDALSKTIPAWCAVLTEASREKYGCPSICPNPLPAHYPFRGTHYTSDSLYTPSHQVPASEHSQMQERVAGWVSSFLASDLPIPRLDKPIMPLFLTRPSNEQEERELLASLKEYRFSDDVYTVILLGASRRVDLPCVSRDETYYYTQGSGDDEEIWSGGLTPGLFWDEEWHGRIMASGHEELPSVIEDVVRRSKAARGEEVSHEDDSGQEDVQVAESIFLIGHRSLSHRFTADERAKYTLLIHCDGQRDEGDDKGTPGATTLYLNIPHGKAGGARFRKSIPVVISAVQSALASSPQASILLCDSTKDRGLAIAMCTALLAAFYKSRETEGLLTNSETRQAHVAGLTKDDIRRRLQWISADVPGANPSRTLMLRINDVLLGHARRGEQT